MVKLLPWKGYAICKLHKITNIKIYEVFQFKISVPFCLYILIFSLNIVYLKKKIFIKEFYYHSRNYSNYLLFS